MSILDRGCNCIACLQVKQNLLNKARKEWDEGIRNIIFKPYHYTCGDGCCDDYGIQVSINGFEINSDGDNIEHVLEDVMEFLQIDKVLIDYEYDE